jgi:hypothetical protein
MAGRLVMVAKSVAHPPPRACQWGLMGRGLVSQPLDH